MGYVKIYRCIQDTDLWDERPFSRGQAFLDLILLANHRDGIVRAKGRRIEVKRGQVGWSEVALANRWGWSRGKVRRFLKEQESEQRIVQQKNNATSVITICNYDQYQGTEQQIGQQTDSRRTADGQQTDTNNNGKNGKNDKKSTGRASAQPPAGGESGESEKPKPKRKKGKTPAQKHDAAVKGYDVSGRPSEIRETWAKFCDIQRDKRKYLNADSIEAIWEKLDAVDENTALCALKDAVAGRWQSVYPKPNRRKAGRPELQPHDHPNSWRGSARYRETDAEALAEKKRKRLERERLQREKETDQ
jgi:hypothetical protein